MRNGEFKGIKRALLFQLAIAGIMIILTLLDDNWIFKSTSIVDANINTSKGGVYLQRVAYRFSNAGLVDVYVYERRDDLTSSCSNYYDVDPGSYCLIKDTSEVSKCSIHSIDSLLPKLIGVGKCILGG